MLEEQVINKLIYKVNTAYGSGTCFALASHGVFVTNYHVVKSFKEVCIENSSKDSFLAKVILVDPVRDLAFLRCEKKVEMPEIQLSSATLQRGDKAFVAGF